MTVNVLALDDRYQQELSGVNVDKSDTAASKRQMSP